MLRRMRWVVLPEETGDTSSQRTPRRCITRTVGTACRAELARSLTCIFSSSCSPRLCGSGAEQDEAGALGCLGAARRGGGGSEASVWACSITARMDGGCLVGDFLKSKPCHVAVIPSRAEVNYQLPLRSCRVLVGLVISSFPFSFHS